MRPSFEVKNKLKYIQESYAEMILRFAAAAEYKAPDIGKHIVRVSDYSVVLAKALDLPPKEIEIMKYASMMHDIGKIGIPDNILRKRSLTPKDFTVMKRHPSIGNKILAGSDSPLLKAASEIALTHHERYDGTGYPRALKGDKIPLRGRIVALADFFDAVASERNYKKAEEFNRVVTMIKKSSGTHFDPGIVKAFLRSLPVIKKILASNKAIDGFLKENKKLLNDKNTEGILY